MPSWLRRDFLTVILAARRAGAHVPALFLVRLMAPFLAMMVAVIAWPGMAAAQQESADPPWRHGTSLSAELKYPEGFAHFDYVNPDAQRGGLVRLSDSSGFDSFNPILPKGIPASGLGLIYQGLMAPSYDEISTSYGLIANAVRYPDDYSWVEYRLNPDARWHDGVPITAEDVVFSFENTVALNPGQAAYYHNVAHVEIIGTDVVRFEFDTPNNRELPSNIGQLLILPKHWWEGVDATGKPRDLGAATLEPTLGSGPYRIAGFEANRNVVYRRVEDYWAQAHPTQIGTNNFDEIRFEVFRDRTVLLEAFKGDRYDFRLENLSKNRATGYDFPAVADGRVVLESFPLRSRGIMQAFVMNLRRPKFADIRLRRALNLAFDFEATNRTAFYGLYKRIPSFFAGTELASGALPKGAERDILESVRDVESARDMVPQSVFDQAYENPVAGDPASLRENLREAVSLLKQAGYTLVDGKMTHVESGQQLRIEFIENDSNAERYVLPYAQNLSRIGIDLELRILDTPQYVARIRSRDFDMSMLAWAQSLNPGNEQRDFWGAAAADIEGSRNYAGINNPAIDALIEKIIYAKDRPELIAATHALDRVLLHNHYVVPLWYDDISFTARWDRFAHPERMPEYSFAFPTIWWWDAARAAAIEAKQ